MPAAAESGDLALPEGQRGIPEAQPDLGQTPPPTPGLSPHLPRFQSALLRGKKSGQSREVHKEQEGGLDASFIHTQTVIETEK